MQRKFTGISAKALETIFALFAVLFLVQAVTGFLTEIYLRVVYVTVGLTLILITCQATKKEPAGTTVPIWDWLLVGVVIAGGVNIILKADIMYRQPWAYTIVDLAFGALTLLLVLETSRRGMAGVLTYIASALILLCLAFPYLPAEFRQVYLTPEFIISAVYFSNEGIYGGIVDLGARIINIFLLFGAFVIGFGGEKVFIDIPMRIAGKSSGGPAKVAIIGSAMMGTITGATVPNVLVTGSFTIPLMKKLGYKPEFAAAVEASASTGGTITPPIMAIAAFIMAELLGVSYLKIIFHAIIPAFLYYVALYTHITLQAQHSKLGALSEEDLPRWRGILTWKSLGPIVIPIGILLLLLAKGFSLQYAGFGTCISMLAIYFLSPPYSLSELKMRAHVIWESLARGGRIIAELAVLIVAVNVVTLLLGITGLAIKLSDIVFVWAEVNIILALIPAAVIPIIFGMAVPPMASYVLAVALVAPLLTSLGFDLLRIHFFTFLYSCLGPITPPVCLAVYAAASIAKCSWLKAAIVSVSITAVAFILPMVVMLNPMFLGIGPPLEILLTVALAVLGIIFLAASFRGYLLRECGIFKRLAYAVSGFMLIFPVSMHIKAIALIGGLALIHTIFKYLSEKRDRCAAIH